ncbi:MAG: cadmium-translocating P-type ATPase [Betaproteobacteria bacterium]|nr:MAG: cadmium-translocating P-type ATPase [Betaproteobacteria bacterium]
MANILAAAPACFHCGAAVLEPGRWRSGVLGAEREFCCAGCEAVACTIVAGGFERYYETRSAAALQPQDLPPTAVYDDPDAQRQFAVRSGAHARIATLILDRIRCAACLWLTEQWLRQLPGLVRVDINYATHRAQVEWDERATRLSRILEAIRAIGYDAYPFDPQRQASLERATRRTALWRLFVAGFGAMQVMMYAVPAYLDGGGTLPPESAQVLRWASLLLTLPVIAFSCGPFFAAAWRDLKGRRVGLDTPIALGIAAGFGASVWATVTASGEVYFDSISMLVFLLLGARYAELLARGRAARGLDRLSRWMPSFALRLNGAAQEKVAAHTLAAGDRVLVPAGERVPADGSVERGCSSADESLLTGESVPVAKAIGSKLIGGSINLEQPLTMRVTQVGAETTAAAIARLVERAAAAKPALVASADRIAHVLTYAVLGTALLAYLGSGNPWIAVAVLVVTCPCALALAAPIALTAAAARLLEQGVALTRSGALEALARASDIVLDKTGTLSTGRLALARTERLGSLGEQDCIALARALEASGRHPVARAFGDGPCAVNVGALTNYPGHGVEACVAGRRVRIGKAAFCAELAGSAAPGGEERTAAWLADASGWLARFALEDPLRAEAASLVQSLHAAGLRVHLVSGDAPRVVEALARSLGIASFAGGATPQDKFAFVERLQADARVVAMLGDGLNDAPVLARADVSIAMGNGSEIAQLQSDLVLLGERLGAVPEALAGARRVMRVIRQNFAWALVYNAVALPAAAAGWVGPWEAAVGMAASSFIVVLNALRLAARGRDERTWKAASTSSFLSRSRSYS